MIFAGADDKMRNLIKSKPRLKCVFTKYYTFSDYNATELTHIFCLLCKQYGYRLMPQAEEHIMMRVTYLEEHKFKDFANAHEIWRLFEHVVANQATRLLTQENEGLSLITEEDILALGEFD